MFFKKKKTNKTIVIAAGGTGGHIFPALVTAKELIARGYIVYFVTDKRFYNFNQYFQEIMNNPALRIMCINVDYLRRGFTAKVIACLMFVFNVYKLRNFLKIVDPALSIGFGSYTSLPVIIASHIRGIPSIVHEQNSVMGLANRISSIFTKAVMVSFPQTHKIYNISRKKVIFTGMPVRPEIRDLYYTNTNYNINYNAFFRTTDRVNIVVLGGSQGARIFSDIVPEMLKFLNPYTLSKLFIYHQCRHSEVNTLASFYNEMGVRYDVASFFADVGKLMTMAHLVITRSGAGSAFDLAATGSPTLFVPYKHAKDNHQYLNAKYFYSNGAALLVEENNLKPEKLAQIITTLIESDSELLNLSQSIKSLAQLNAHEKICQIVDFIVHKTDFNLHAISPKEVRRHFKTTDVGIG